MQRVRVLCPTEHTEDVLSLLRDEPGATHIAQFRGAALVPPGDVVEADVAREALEQVLARLCELELDHVGGISIETVDTTLSDMAVRAEEDAPGDGADAVVWEELLARTGEEAKLNGTYLAFLTIACLLAAVGVVTGSAVTVVGAMVLGPEFGPLAAVAVGLVRRRWDLARRAVGALLVGFAVAVLITALGTALFELTGLLHPSDLRDLRAVDFVFEVAPFSPIVALLAGAAGMLSMTSVKSAALVGVFISVTTVPAAGFAAVAAVLGDWGHFGESLFQLAVNLVGIVVAATVVLVIRRGTAVGPVKRRLSAG